MSEFDGDGNWELRSNSRANVFAPGSVLSSAAPDTVAISLMNFRRFEPIRFFSLLQFWAEHNEALSMKAYWRAPRLSCFGGKSAIDLICQNDNSVELLVSEQLGNCTLNVRDAIT